MERARGIGGRTRAPQPVVARAPGGGGPAGGMRRLQSAIGNAAMSRLAAARSPRVLARFGEPEHKAIGDKALPDMRWRLRKAGTATDNPFTDFQLTFGDWIALGDWFEDVNEIRDMLRPGKQGEDRIGELYYALFVRIRPKTQAESDAAQRLGGKEGGLWTEEDQKAVDMRYQTLKTRNIKHFANPLVGDTKLSTAEKSTRTKDGKPFGAVAQYHHDHLEAIGIAITAAHTPDESLMGEALAHDGFACHFLTDAFSGSHARTPRASIEEYWDKKVPKFDERLVNWLADEATWVVINHPHTEVRKKGLPGGIEELGAGVAPGKARAAIRKLIRPEVPALSFGDLVGLVVHDWEGSHGAPVKGPDGKLHGHGPLVEVAGQRFHLAGDDDMLPAVPVMQNVNTDKELTAALKDRKRSDAERTFAGASLAVRASVNDITRAFELAKADTDRSRIIGKLMDKSGLFASERMLPGVVPDSEQPEEDWMPKWDYDTVDQLLNDTKIQAALPMSADRVGAPFNDTLKGLEASQAVKDHLRKAVVEPLTSHSVPRIIEWLKAVIGYTEATLFKRLRPAPGPVERNLSDVRQSAGAR
jgi:hypothetical protein